MGKKWRQFVAGMQEYERMCQEKIRQDNAAFSEAMQLERMKRRIRCEQ